MSVLFVTPFLLFAPSGCFTSLVSSFKLYFMSSEKESRRFDEMTPKERSTSLRRAEETRMISHLA